MKSRYFICGFLMATVLGGQAPATLPNVVMIIGDDQAWSDFGFTGSPTIHTPNLDRLAAESAVYTRGYLPMSLYRPSLATLSTGLYAVQHKITFNYKPAEFPSDESRHRQKQIEKHFDGLPTLPRLLAEKGYQSLQTGKWWERPYTRGGFTQGMTRGGGHGDAGLTIGREGLRPIFDFIEQRGDSPFFVWYAPFLPHTPHNPPQELLDKYYPEKTHSIHLGRYWAMCEWLDQTCGELLDYLDQQGLSENTLLVFVSDNGWVQRTDSLIYPPLKTTRRTELSKRTPYEGGIRTPIVLRWPQRIRPKRDEQTLVSSVDLVPTILAACGIEPTNQMQGVNLLDQASLARRQAIYGEIYNRDPIDFPDSTSTLMSRWCISDRWRLVAHYVANIPDGEIKLKQDTSYLPDGEFELYDLFDDPQEAKNVAGAHPDRVEKMRKQIEDWWTKAGGT